MLNTVDLTERAGVGSLIILLDYSIVLNLPEKRKTCYLVVCHVFTGTKALEGIRDPLKIVQIIRENDQIGFLYLSNAVPKTSVDYHYYNLKVCLYLYNVVIR